MFQSALVWVFALWWSSVVGVPLIVLSACTLGLLRRQIITPAARVWAAPILFVAGIRFDVRGREHLTGKAPRVVTINHTSWVDAFVVCMLAPPGMVPLGKRELLFMPLIGQIFWAAGVVFIDRSNPKRAYASLQKVGAWLKRQRLSAMIAPEGTRSADSTLLPFKRGAFVLAQSAAVPIVPVVIHGAHRFMKRGHWRIHPGVLVIDAHPARLVPSGANPKRAAEMLRDDYAAWLAAGP